MKAIRIGVTGHRWNKIDRRAEAGLSDLLRRALADIDKDLTGEPARLVCGMAEGTDLCAAAVRPAGWRLEAVLALPPVAWREHLAGVSSSDAASFDRLIAEANLTLPRAQEEGLYSAVADHIAASSDRLVAVWDGKPGGRGGTADVVARCRARGMPVLVLPIPEVIVGA